MLSLVVFTSRNNSLSLNIKLDAGECRPECLAGCYLEGQDRGVDIVVGAIVKGGNQVHDGEACQGAAGHHFFQALSHTRDVFLGHLQQGKRISVNKADFSPNSASSFAAMDSQKTLSSLEFGKVSSFAKFEHTKS